MGLDDPKNETAPLVFEVAATKLPATPEDAPLNAVRDSVDSSPNIPGKQIEDALSGHSRDEVAGVTEVTDEGKAATPSARAASQRGNSGDKPKRKPQRAESDYPSESDRPCFRVFPRWVESGGHKLRPGVWHFGLRHSKGDKPPVLVDQWVSSPIYVDAVTRDSSDLSYGRMLSFRNSSERWHKWAMPMEMLSGHGDELRGELLHRGVEIDPQHGRILLSMYLTSVVPPELLRCATHVGWCDGSFVLPDGVIGPGAKTIVFQSDGRTIDEYATSGSMAGWKNGVAANAVGNPTLMFAISVAFSGPLLNLLSAESGGVHIVGDSSTGKTTAADAACSVWGGSTYKRSWRATANGLEGAAVMFNDALLCLDEISECDPREVGSIVYALGNGQGKQRASRSGSARSVARWRCAVVSTGERTVATAMAEGGRRAKAGQTVRILDISARGQYGIFDDLHNMGSGAALSDAIKSAAKAHHGHAGRLFLRKLTQHVPGRLVETFEKFKALRHFSPTSTDGLIRRGAARFALIAMAGELATEYGLTGWKEGAAIEAARACFISWLEEQRPGNAEREQIVDAVQDFIERHGDARFSSIDGASDDDDEASHGLIVRDRAGWWSDKDEDRRYLFTSQGLREAAKGFDLNPVLRKLVETGALEPPGKDGKHSRVVRINNQSVRGYWINPSAWGARDGH